jgi:hypothetical protein
LRFALAGQAALHAAVVDGQSGEERLEVQYAQPQPRRQRDSRRWLGRRGGQPSPRENLPFAQGAVIEPNFVDDPFEVSGPPAADGPTTPAGARDRRRQLSNLAEFAVDIEIIMGVLEDDRQVLPGAVKLMAGAKALVLDAVGVADRERPSIQLDGEVPVDSQAGRIAEDQPIAAVIGRGLDPGHKGQIAGEVQPLGIGEFHHGVGAVERERGAVASPDPLCSTLDAAVMVQAGGVANRLALAFVEAPVADEPFLVLRPARRREDERQ